MNLPFEYDHVTIGEFGGTTPTTTNFEKARVVILPVPLDRTTSYVPGTRTASIGLPDGSFDYVDLLLVVGLITAQPAPATTTGPP